MRRVFNEIGSFLQTPVGVILITTVIFHGVLLGVGLNYRSPVVLGISVFLLILDAGIAFYLIDRLVYFFSQFVLPVQTDKDRDEIFARVNDFHGKRGPTLFVKNGQLIKHEGEMEKQGPGVIVLDTASAVVIQTRTAIVGAAGPGIRFTKGNEFITRFEGVDLRAQWQFIGPMASDQPFLNPAPFPDQKRYMELHVRRQQTAGHTRDGFEVSPTMSIKFRIKPVDELTPSESGVVSQYRYNATAVLNAVTRELIELGTADNKRNRLEWNRLPAHLVVNLWREYVRKFKLEDLFKADGVSGLQTIEEMINRRVKRAQVVGMDDTGVPTGEAVFSLEYHQLAERGLEIMEVRIHNVLFDPSIEEQSIKNWNAEWTKIAKREEDTINEQEKLSETVGHNEAIKKFARIAAQKFDNPIAEPQELYSTLMSLIEPVRETLIKESRANTLIEGEAKKLEEVWKWLLVNKMDETLHSKGDQS
jgi:hypothetical protein